MVIKKYNELINKYNDLINKKNINQNKRVKSESINKNKSLLNNNNNKLSERSKMATINNFENRMFNSINLNILRKEKKLRNNNPILINGNIKKINTFDNEYIIHLRKENDVLKKIIKTYKNINFNSYKKPVNTLKERNYFIQNRIIGKSFQNNSKSKNGSRNHSNLIKNYNGKNSQSIYNSFNKSQILIPMKTLNNINNKNNYIDYFYKTDSSEIMPKNNKLSENTLNNKNFNTINNNNFNLKNKIKKNNTYVKSISGSLNKSKISNQRIYNKLKVRCRNYLFNDNINNLESSNNLSKDKINKMTPKNSDSFLPHTNYNIKNKFTNNNNKLATFQKLDLDNNFIYTDNYDNIINTESNYYNNNYDNEKSKNEINLINDESKNKTINNNLIIHRNTEHKMGNKFRLIKEFKTETEKFYTKLKNEIFSGENEESSNNNNQKIKINKKDIFFKKSQNSLKNALTNINPNLNEISDYENNTIRTTNNTQIMNNTTITKTNKNKLILNNKKINNNIFNTKKNQIKDKKSQKKLPLYNNKKLFEKSARISTLGNNKKKTLTNTINNISNFNNCSYIYLFNNGEKFVKINKQFKI